MLHILKIIGQRKLQMIQYIKKIILLYVNANREKSDDTAVVSMDNFKGQVIPAIAKLLEENTIYVCLLPPNTTDKLQPYSFKCSLPLPMVDKE